MLMLFFIISFLLMFFLSIISWLLKYSSYKSREKSSPFECGFDTSHKMRNSFSLRFFLITLLFLIFDVEAAIIFPIPLNISSMLSSLIFIPNLIIFFLLSAGLLLEWKQGALEWKWTYI